MSWIEDEYKKEIDDSLQLELDMAKLRFGCWIDLEGRIYRTNFAEHCILAHRLLCVKCNRSFDEEIEFEDNDRLVGKGWILIQRISPFNKIYEMYYKKLSLINPKQHDIIKKLKVMYENSGYMVHEIEYNQLR